MAAISATGTERRAAAGFSLVELLVVLVVLGLLAGAVMMTAPAGGARVDDQAELLAAHLQRAREEAVLANRAVAVRVDADGYRFLERRLDGWRELSDKPLHARQFGEGISARFLGRDDYARFEFDATGGSTPAEVVLRGDSGALRIVLDDAGEVALHAAR